MKVQQIILLILFKDHIDHGIHNSSAVFVYYALTVPLEMANNGLNFSWTAFYHSTHTENLINMSSDERFDWTTKLGALRNFTMHHVWIYIWPVYLQINLQAAWPILSITLSRFVFRLSFTQSPHMYYGVYH